MLKDKYPTTKLSFKTQPSNKKPKKDKPSYGAEHAFMSIGGLLLGFLLTQYTGFGDSHSAEVSIAKMQIRTHKFKVMYYIAAHQNQMPPSIFQHVITNNSREEDAHLDPWSNPYIYKITGSGFHDYQIISYGADGKSGGSRANKDITSADF
jgi:type II secretory pathway pseudopilin PulG